MTKNKKGESSNYFSSTDLFVYAWEKRFPLLIITVVAAILSIAVSLTITPKYKSVVILFPTSGSSLTKSTVTDIYEIGDEEQAEHLMQILASEGIRERIIQKYNLMDHYGIDSISKFPKTRINAEYTSNIRFRRTEFMSIMVEVLDKDPQMAADIANDISSLADTVFNGMLKQRAVDIYLLREREFNEAYAGYQEMKDSLDVISSLGINSYAEQADRYYEAYGNALVSGNDKAIKILEQKLKLMSRYGGTYESYSNQLLFESERISELKQALLEAKVESEQNLPHKFIVQSAFKAEKKAYPNKSLIVLISTFSAFLLGLILLVMIDTFKTQTR